MPLTEPSVSGVILAGVGIDWIPILAFVGIWLGLVAGILFFLKARQYRPPPMEDASDPSGAPFKQKTKSGEPKIKTGEIKPPTTVHKQIQATITERTRDEMFEMISQVKSLTQEMARPKMEEVDLSDEEIKRLNESGVVKGLIDTLMTEVQTEDVKGLKFSKMTLDASLFFDEKDVPFFEKEFGEKK